MGFSQEKIRRLSVARARIGFFIGLGFWVGREKITLQGKIVDKVLFTKKIFTTEIAEKKSFEAIKIAKEPQSYFLFQAFFKITEEKLKLLYLPRRRSGRKWIPLSEISWI